MKTKKIIYVGNIAILASSVKAFEQMKELVEARNYLCLHIRKLDDIRGVHFADVFTAYDYKKLQGFQELHELALSRIKRPDWNINF